MPKIEITASSSTFKVKMNDYSPTLTETKRGSWDKSNISFHEYSNYILVLIEGEKEWRIAPTEDLANEVLGVDSVGGTPTTTLEELYNWLELNHAHSYS